MTDFDPEDLRDEVGGDGAARVTLSEAIAAVRAQLQDCDADLEAARLRLTGQELPDVLDMDALEFERPAVQAREVTRNLKNVCDNASERVLGNNDEYFGPISSLG